jgi:2-polyprenyl-6-methoxyphenol hydroxylase-like FAD-dependent oxidoreductase
VIGKHTSGGHNELAMPDEVLPLFSHYCEKPTKLMRTPKEFRRWMLLYRQPVDNWVQGRVALLGDAAHFMLQYMAQGAAMAMEDAVCLGACADAASGNFEKAFQSYQKTRLVRATRVQISANQLVGMIFHVPDTLERRGAQRHVPRPLARALLRRARVGASARRTMSGTSRSEQVGADLLRRCHAAQLHRAHKSRSTGSRGRGARPGSPRPSRQRG